MSSSNQIGLSRFELEHEFNWLTRNPPKEPAKLVKFLGKAIISLIVKNNDAIARNLAAEETPESEKNF